MKTDILIAVILGTFLVSNPASAQEGNTAVRDLLKNPDLQDILRSAKNDPEAAAKAIQNNPDALIRNATAVFADKQGKKDSTAVPATRATKSQSDKALEQMREVFANPSSTQPGKTNPMPEVNAATKENLQETAVEAIRKMRFDTNRLKEAADKALGTETPAISAPIDPLNRGTTTKIAPITSPRPIEPAPRMVESPIDTTNRISTTQSAPVPMRNMEPTSPQIPDSPELNSGGVPAPAPLEARYPKPKKFRATPDPEDASEDTMVITSNESEMDNNKHTLTFRGDVLVEMKDMELTCDNLIVYMDSNNEMQRTVATGGMVQVKRIGEGGKLQISKSQRAEHIAATETTILSGGPPFLQDGDRYVNTDSPDSKIILGGDGKYKVHSPDSPGRSVIVVPISNGKGITDGLGLDKKLKNIGR